MGTENRRNSRTAFRLTAFVLSAALICVCWFLITQYRDMKAMQAEIAELETEKQSLEEEVAQNTAKLNDLEAETAELNLADEKLAQAKQGFYDTCAKLEEEILSGENPHKIAYLTFDDGPYENTTGKYLDVLKEHDVLATFFQLGKPSEKLDALYHRAYDEGHTIANHTYSHQIHNGIYRSVNSFIQDVKKNREFIEEKLGYTTDILRFPGGSSTARSLKNGIVEELRKLGYGYVDWNSATGDGLKLMSAEEYRDNVLKNTGGRKVLVVLMHDYSQNTLIALPEIIDGLRAQGYTLLPLFYESAMIKK